MPTRRFTNARKFGAFARKMRAKGRRVSIYSETSRSNGRTHFIRGKVTYTLRRKR